jgi:hypothetical protein
MIKALYGGIMNYDIGFISSRGKPLLAGGRLRQTA